MMLSLSTLSREEQKEQIPCLHGAEEKTKTYTLLCEFTKSAFEDSNFTNSEVPTLCVYPCVWEHVCGRCPCARVCMCPRVLVHVHMCIYLHVCVLVCIHVCKCTCICLSVEAKGQPWVLFFRSDSLCF